MLTGALSGRPQAARLCRAPPEPLHAGRQLRDIPRFEEESRFTVFEPLSDPADASGDGRKTVAHGFDPNEAERFR